MERQEHEAWLRRQRERETWALQLAARETGRALAVPGEAPGGTAPLPTHGADPHRLLREASTLLFEHSLFNGHPRFWGYVTSSAAPT